MDDPIRKALEELAKLAKLANDPSMKALEEMAKLAKLANDPNMKALEELAKLEKLANDPLRKMLEEMAKMENDPIRKALKAFENDPVRKAIDAIEKSRPSLEPYHLPELRMPEFHIPDIPTQEEVNEYQSAGVLLQRLADSIIQWRSQLPPDQQPAILAILNGGILINVDRLAEESFHGIRIEGKMQGNPCMVLAHQATVQLLCYIEKVEKKELGTRIGFIIDGKEQQV